MDKNYHYKSNIILKTTIFKYMLLFFTICIFTAPAYSESYSPIISLDKKGAYIHFRENKIRIIYWCRIFHNEGVPAAIKSVYAICPDQKTKINIPYYPEESKSNLDGVYEIHYDFSLLSDIQEGLYTFVVIDYNNNFNYIFDWLTINEIQPAPFESLTPIHNQYFDILSPLFSWEHVKNVAYYLVKVYDNNFKTIHKGKVNTNSYTLPDGILSSSDYFRFRIEMFGEFDQYDIESHGRTPGATLDANVFHTSNSFNVNPAIDDNNIGVCSLYTKDNKELLFQVIVRSGLGVPNGINSVSVDISSSKFLLTYKKKITKNEGLYELKLSENFINEGEFCFTVSDINGNMKQIKELFFPQSITELNFFPITPTNGSVLNTTKPSFRWNLIENTIYYILYIYDFNGNEIGKYQTSNNSFKLLSDILSTKAKFFWKIDAITRQKENNIDCIVSSASTKDDFFYLNILSLYDFDNDEDITEIDISYIANRWNSNIFDNKRYSRIYDFNNNQKIDLLDIMKVCKKITPINY